MMPRSSVILALSLWALLLPAHTATSSTVHVASGLELVQALQDAGVSSIVLDRAIRLENGDFPAFVIKLNRNLTISSPLNGPHQVLDFNARSVSNKLSIQPGYNLSLVHLTIKDTRYGPGADVDVLASSPNGILYLDDLAKDQASCPPLDEQQVMAYPRDPTVPGTNIIAFPGPLDWDGVPFNYSIHYVDFSTRMSIGENAADRGYVVHKQDSWKLCKRVVDPACVAQGDTASCIKAEMDADFFARFPQAQQGQLSPAAKAGIAAAAAVAGAAALAAAAALLLIQHRKRQKAAAAALLPVHTKLGSTAHSSSGSSSDEIHSSYNSPDGPTQHHSRPTAVCSLGSVPSWKGCSVSVLTGTSRCSSSMPGVAKGTLSAQQAAELQLGSLIGAGSFGRVFLGSAAGKEVAIKVVHHDSKSAPQVASEVELMMKFDHPNLIKAYHFVTWGSAGVSVRLTREHNLNDSAYSSRTLTGVLSNGGLGSGSPICSDSGTSTPGPHRMLETWIICELANAGNLQDAIMQHNGGAFFYQNMPHMGIILHTLLGVANGMEWLHANNVLHGDLKAANVMLTIVPSGGGKPSTQSDSSQQPGSDAAVGHELLPKVTDFGLSRMMCEGATHLSTHTVGTITHQPPELMRSGRLSKPADVFAFGVLMWEVIMAAHPWKGMMMGEIMNNVMVEGQRLKFGPLAPKAFAALAEQCWLEDPGARPTFTQLTVLLQQLQQQEQALQDEVASVCGGIVGGWGEAVDEDWAGAGGAGAGSAGADSAGTCSEQQL